MATFTVTAPAPVADLAAARRATERAMRTALKNGWTATRGPRSAYYVPSQSRVRTARVVETSKGQDGVLWFSCSCEGSYYRPETPCACWHAAAVGAAMHLEGWATIRDGLFVARDKRRAPNGRFMAKS